MCVSSSLKAVVKIRPNLVPLTYDFNALTYELNNRDQKRVIKK